MTRQLGFLFLELGHQIVDQLVARLDQLVPFTDKTFQAVRMTVGVFSEALVFSSQDHERLVVFLPLFAQQVLKFSLGRFEFLKPLAHGEHPLARLAQLAAAGF